MAPPLDLVIGDVRLVGANGPFDIGIAQGRIAAIAPTIEAEAPREDARGALAFGGFVETHIHLDKASILDRCTVDEGTLAEAVRETARAKAAFTEEDVFHRARSTLEKAILHGTTRMRTFVEVDPRAGFRSLEALLRLKRDYAFAIDLELCAFAQEGLTNEPETIGMLEQALALGADLLGGCPYQDPDPERHVRVMFDLAEAHGVAVDFHADFDLDPRGLSLPSIIAETTRRGLAGRVSVGHVTKLSAMGPDGVRALGIQLSEAGIAVTVLPATDLFLMGRGTDLLIPRGIAPALALHRHGVLCTVASNNILNPFTPYGDASLGRMANLYANTAQVSRHDDLEDVFAMVTRDAARLLGAPYGIEVGAPADIVLIDAPDPASAVRECSSAIAGWKRGVRTFSRPRAVLHRPRPDDGPRPAAASRD